MLATHQNHARMTLVLKMALLLNFVEFVALEVAMPWSAVQAVSNCAMFVSDLSLELLGLSTECLVSKGYRDAQEV